jgi:hypothetical protein
MTSVSIYSNEGIEVDAYEEAPSNKTEPVRILLRHRVYFLRFRDTRKQVLRFKCMRYARKYSRALPVTLLRFWYDMISCRKEGPKRDMFRDPSPSDALLYETKTLEQGYQVLLSCSTLPSGHIILKIDYLSVLISLKNVAAELRLRIWGY